MDEKFLEFWGNLLISFAKGKKQSDDAAAMMQKNIGSFNALLTSLTQKNLTNLDDLFSSIIKKNLNDFNSLFAMFQNLYGLNKVSESGSEYNIMAKQAVEDFQKSFKEYLAFTGFVSREEHIALVQKYEKLKEKCASQEETIAHLKMLLGKKIPDQSDVIKSFQNIVKDQTDLFQKMMKDFIQSPDKKESSASSVGSKGDKSEQKHIKKKGDIKDDGRDDESQTMAKTDG